MIRRIIIWIGIGIAVVVGLLAVSGAGFYSWSQTEAGRSWIASRIAGLAKVSGEREVTIGRLAGDLFQTIHLKDVSVRDNAGVWLSIGSVEIRWHPWSLLRGRVTLDRLHGNDVILTRAPFTAGAPTELGDILRAARQLQRYRLNEFALTDLTLGPAVLDENAVLRIRGSAGVPQDDAVRTSLTVERIDGVKGRAAFSAAYPASGQTFDVDLRVDEPANGLIARVLGIPDLPALHGRLIGTGPLSAWAGDAKLTLDSFARLSAKFTVRPGAKTTFDVSGEAVLENTGAATGIALPGWPELKLVLGDTAAWQGSGELDFRRRLLTARRLVLSGAFGALSGSGRYDIGKGAGTAAIALRDNDLARLASVLGIEIAGQADILADVQVGNFGATIAANIRGGARGLGTGQSIVDRLLTPMPRVAGRLSFVPGKLTISELTVTSDAAALRLDGAMQFNEPALTADYRLTVPDGASLPVLDAMEIKCRCLAEGKLSGPLDDPQISGTFSAATMSVAGALLQEPSLAYRLRTLVSGLNGDLEGNAGTRLGRFAAHTGLRFARNQWEVSGLHVEGSKASLDGSLAIPASGEPVTGRFQAKFGTLGPWLDVAGIGGAGKGELRVTFQPDGGRQEAELVAEIADARINGADDRPPIEIARLTAQGTIHDLLAWKDAKATIEAQSATIGEARMRRILVRATGSLARVAVEASADGDWGEPISLRTAFHFTAEERQNRIAVANLEGRVLNENLSLKQPFQVIWKQDGIAVDALALSLGKARLAGNLQLAPETIDGALRVAELPLRLTERLWPTGLSGTLSGKASLRGARSAPEGMVSATITGLQLPAHADNSSLTLAVTGEWRNGGVALEGRISGADAPPAQITANFPLRFEESGWKFTVPPHEPVSAKVAWQGDMATLWQFFPVPEHQLSGDGKVDVQLTGSLARPNLRGWLAVRTGRYESLQLGTVLKALDLRIDFDGKSAEITRFAGDDGDGGKITAKGGMVFDSASGHPFELSLTLAKFAISRRDDIEAVASGTLQFKGTTREAIIDGVLETDSAEIRVIKQLPPGVVELDVVEIGGLAGIKPNSQRTQRVEFDPSLKIRIEMSRRVFIRGRGIDSEWKGQIVLAGSVQEPRLSGNMEIVRGLFSIAGKDFKFQSGLMRLPDRPDAVPVLDVTAIHDGHRIRAKAQVEGPVNNPTVTLTSTPHLPQDEILSQILFDKGASKLSGVEAAQLAIALAQLSGEDAGVGNTIEFARKTLGVDVLRLETTRTADGEDETQVRGGKYVTEDIFIGVKQGTSTESGAVGVEVQVTPNIVIESEVGRSGESDTTIKFKLDY